MLKIQSILGLVILCFMSSCHSSQVLFQENPKDWEVYGAANWKFSNNAFTGKIIDGAGYMVTKQSYQDFTLELEFKPDSTINSGVFIRCQKEDINPTNCYELNIWDLHPNQESRTGAVVTKTVPLAYVETINKWNIFKIKAEKNRLKVWVNGTLTADTQVEELSGGYIGLQASGTGEIKFRNVKIKSQ